MLVKSRRTYPEAENGPPWLERLGTSTRTGLVLLLLNQPQGKHLEFASATRKKSKHIDKKKKKVRFTPLG